MKRPVLCIFLAMFMAFTAIEPFAGLNAAELWNSRKNTVTDKKTYKFYKKRQESSREPVTLYNAQTPRKSYGRKYGAGVKAALYEYKNVKRIKQQKSKLWDRMSPGAVKNRWADTDNALQIEYETRKATAKHMVSVFKQMRSDKIKSERKYQEQLADYYEKKREEERARQEEKEYVLSGGSRGYKRSNKSSYKKRKNIIYKKKPYSGSKEIRVKLDKPKPLFNSPNR